MLIAIIIFHDFNHGEVWSEHISKSENKNDFIELAEEALCKRKVKMLKEFDFDENDRDKEESLNNLFDINTRYHEI
jgi:hypothetical protein